MYQYLDIPQVLIVKAVSKELLFIKSNRDSCMQLLTVWMKGSIALLVRINKSLAS